MRFEAKRDIKTGEMRYDEKKRNCCIVSWDDAGGLTPYSSGRQGRREAECSVCVFGGRFKRTGAGNRFETAGCYGGRFKEVYGGNCDKPG